MSSDDAKRNEMYRENAERRRLESSFTDYHEYLLSLDMKGVIKPFEPIYWQRIAQLSNKSNQFNLTTKRYTENEIEELSKNDSYITLYGKLIDRFGDNGVVSVVIGHIVEDVCHIDLWIMSCRVLKRDMEFAMMDALVHRCIGKNIRTIYGYYYPTEKNGMVRDFYDMMGFDKLSEDDVGNTEWQFIIPEQYQDKQNVIKTEEEL